MKKTLIASAIAAVGFSGAALAAESNLPTVYGNIQLAATHVDEENGDSKVNLGDNGSTIGLTHSHEIAPGVTGFFKAELEFDADDKAGNGGLNAFDEAYIGVKGDSFGQVWVGSDDSRYETAVDEIDNYFEALGSGTAGSYTTGEGDLIQYSSPNFGGLVLSAAAQVNGDDTAGGKSYPYQLSAVYAVDNLELAVAMDSNDGTTGYSDTTLDSVNNNENTYGLRASYTMGDLRVTGQYQTRKDAADVWGLFAGYSIGANSFAVAYGFKDADNTDAETSTITLQALHNVSDNMYVYVEGGLANEDDGTTDADTTTLALGATYYF
jgi:predicted porin